MAGGNHICLRARTILPRVTDQICRRAIRLRLADLAILIVIVRPIALICVALVITCGMNVVVVVGRAHHQRLSVRVREGVGVMFNLRGRSPFCVSLLCTSSTHGEF